MKKIILAGLVAFTLLSISGTASAFMWYDFNHVHIRDADVEITASVHDTEDDREYWLDVVAGVEGSGEIDMWGNQGIEAIDTDVETEGCGESHIYASEQMFVTGCLTDCCLGDCCECPTYEYLAYQSADITGRGKIDLDSNVENGDDNTQELDVCGRGTFTAGLMVDYDIIYPDGDDCDEDPDVVNELHIMGAGGTNVKFNADGDTWFDVYDGDAGGQFSAWLRFRDCGCDDGGCGC